MYEYKELAKIENENYITNLLSEHQLAELNIINDEDKIFSYGVYDDQKYIGGITGKLWFKEFHVSLLAINNDYRGKNLGSELINLAEKFARENGAELITITTQDYQAPRFYQKLGYEIFGELIDCPFKGSTRYYLVKRLA